MRYTSNNGGSNRQPAAKTSSNYFDEYLKIDHESKQEEPFKDETMEGEGEPEPQIVFSGDSVGK